MSKTSTPLDALGQQIDPDALYVAIDAYASDVGGGFVAQRGLRLHGSHPAVQANGLFWAREGYDDLTILAARQALTRTAQPEDA